MNTAMKYIALIGDIVGSKNLKNRDVVQDKLEGIFKQLNYRRKDITSKYTITLGDEFQALYSRADNLFSDIITIKTELMPVNVRISLAVGEMSTSIKKTAIGMDGPAYHMARRGISSLKKSKNLLMIDMGKSSGLVESLVELGDHNMKKWTLTRYRILEMMMAGVVVREIAKNLKISERAVYKSINAGALTTYEKIFNSLSGEFNHVLGIN